MLNLCKGARPDERFHLQDGPPVPHLRNLGLLRIVTWSNLMLPDGGPGSFQNWWIIGNLVHWYFGNVKCDATRTFMYWAGQLDDGIGTPYSPDANKYVMTTTPTEKQSVRFFTRVSTPVWNNMGGA